MTEQAIIKILKELAEAGKTILVVHHDLSTVEDYFDHVILLNQRLVAYGTVASTFNTEKIGKTYGGQLPIIHIMGAIDEK